MHYSLPCQSDRGCIILKVNFHFCVTVSSLCDGEMFCSHMSNACVCCVPTSHRV